MQTGAEAYAAARTVYTTTKTPFGKAPLRQAAQDLAQHYTHKKKTKSATTSHHGNAPAASTTPATPNHPGGRTRDASVHANRSSTGASDSCADPDR